MDIQCPRANLDDIADHTTFLINFFDCPRLVGILRTPAINMHFYEHALRRSCGFCSRQRERSNVFDEFFDCARIVCIPVKGQYFLWAPSVKKLHDSAHVSVLPSVRSTCRLPRLR
jgi:hypothetical protein